MESKYDKIGIKYATKRKTDARIAKQIFSKLKGAERIVNIGAGTGSYEPLDIPLVAVEPSGEMIKQRSPEAHPVVQASAEQLPFEDDSFSHASSILSMHHWTDRPRAFAEINRVVREKFVTLTWNPAADPFWLTRDYFPEIYETDLGIFPSLQELKRHFKEIEVSPLLIPEDCQDGFLAAYWKRPEAYLDAEVRRSISTFAKLKTLDKGLARLQADLNDGSWQKRNESILNASSLDAGYVIVSATV